MKKLVIAFGFLLFIPAFQPVQAEVVNYWDYWANKAQSTQQYQAKTPSIWGRSRSYAPRTTTRQATTQQATTSSVAGSSRSRWLNYLRSKYKNRLSTRTTSAPAPAQDITREGVRATVTPITLRQDINNITAAPVDLFRIGLSHNAVRSSDYTAAVYIDEMQFQIADNTGVVSDFSDFALTAEGQEFDFDQQGFVTLRFRNLRLARSESRGLDIAIKIDEPDNFPRLPGSFRVKMTGVDAYQEFSQTKVDVGVSGRTASDYVVLNPRPSISAGGTAQANIYTGQTVNGRSLGGGEKALLMALTLNASADDFLLESLSVTNQHGSNADQIVSRAKLVNMSNGTVVDTTQFVNGRATFDLPNNQQVYIARNNTVRLGIEVEIVSSPNVDAIDNRLTLLLDSDDIELFGIGAGKEVPDNRKSVSVDTETFVVSKGTLTAQGGIYFSDVQPAFFPIGQLGQVARFKITNGGSRDVSFGRFSLQISPNGVVFTNGGTIADVKLVELINGTRERDRFTTVSFAGGVATFDPSSEIYVNAGQTREFALRANLTNTGANSDNDGVAVTILGDSTLQKGTLAAVRGTGARFIWSDHSGSPHTPSSQDWFSGYHFPGVPTNAFVNKND